MEELKHDNQQYENYSEVGIEWYMNDNKPILNGVVKHRYSDFIVNEIDTDGNIAMISRDVDVAKEIKELEETKEKKSEDSKQPEEEKKTEEGPKKIVVNEDAKTAVEEVLLDDGPRLLEHIRKINEGLWERTEELALSNIIDI